MRVGEDVLQVRRQVSRQVPLVQEHLSGERDAHQDVVEVVGDAARQLPESSHPILPLHLLLKTLALGDVYEAIEQMFASVQHDRNDRLENRHALTIGLQ